MAGGQDPVSSLYRHFEFGEEPGDEAVRFTFLSKTASFVVTRSNTRLWQVFLIITLKLFFFLHVQIVRRIDDIPSHSLPPHQAPTHFEERAET